MSNISFRSIVKDLKANGGCKIIGKQYRTPSGCDIVIHKIENDLRSTWVVWSDNNKKRPFRSKLCSFSHGRSYGFFAHNENVEISNLDLVA